MHYTGIILIIEPAMTEVDHSIHSREWPSNTLWFTLGDPDLSGGLE